MSPDERSVLDAAENWARACEQVLAKDEGPEPGDLGDELLVDGCERALIVAVRRWRESRRRPRGPVGRAAGQQP